MLHGAAHTRWSKSDKGTYDVSTKKLNILENFRPKVIILNQKLTPWTAQPCETVFFDHAADVFYNEYILYNPALLEIVLYRKR